MNLEQTTIEEMKTTFHNKKNGEADSRKMEAQQKFNNMENRFHNKKNGKASNRKMETKEVDINKVHLENLIINDPTDFDFFVEKKAEAFVERNINVFSECLMANDVDRLSILSALMQLTYTNSFKEGAYEVMLLSFPPNE
jgi:hypothetical protein